MTYVFRPGTRKHETKNGTCTIHAGNGLTTEALQRAVSLYARFIEENEVKKHVA